MASLADIMEQIRLRREDPSTVESKVKNLIEKGRDIDPEFWDKLVQILHNSDGMAALLGVSENQILTWAEKIRKAEHNADTSLSYLVPKKRRILSPYD